MKTADQIAMGALVEMARDINKGNYIDDSLAR